jgi:hypothetical protein
MQDRARFVSYISYVPVHPVPENLFLRQSHRSAVRIRWSTALAHVPVHHSRH